ncbi:AraC family transcriptional regulator [Actomonas aquatica]|uniref:AraC family transcriptional regulator n=1 Tax=Actomonas aquatica TaxID=2866162 RepID=A0ABZ1C2Y1_9BACT|nr:AraC family transcriptional regulator [Opitutus sp. WL0086]WRQ85608.1 AraC family transcriptional regulator [Opitutus sp. WL0086]
MESDDFSGLLEGPRARGAFALRGLMAPPWGLRMETASPVTVWAVVRGACHMHHDNGDAVSLGPGDVAITRAPGNYTVTDTPGTTPTIRVLPGQDCRGTDGQPLTEELKLGVRTWGNDPAAPTLFLVGSYDSAGDISARLRDALPPLLWVKQAEWDSPLVDLLSAEMARDAPGQAAVLDRLLDMLLIAVLRTWFARGESRATPWYQAKGDPVVTRTLKLIHQQPAEPWTLARLAAAVGVSRASLARRFQEIVGESPMAFLTQWRLALAADLLSEPDATVGTVAEQVGYGSPYALSAAFKRVRGISPSEHRARVLADG